MAEPDPRDYALVPMDYLLEKNMKSTPMFLSTADEVRLLSTTGAGNNM